VIKLNAGDAEFETPDAGLRCRTPRISWRSAMFASSTSPETIP
jgi:hypothetical protein